MPCAKVFIEAMLDDGSTAACLLQNAETVRLVAPAEQLDLHSPSEQMKPWRAISVAMLQQGDRVLVHRPAAPARHMGIAIDEFIAEV